MSTPSGKSFTEMFVYNASLYQSMLDTLNQIFDEFKANHLDYIEAALSYTNDSNKALEIVTETFVTALKDPVTLPSDTNIENYIQTLLLDTLERNGFTVEPSFDIPDHYIDPTDTLIRSERNRKIREVIAEKGNLNTREMLAVLAEIESQEKIGNMLEIEGVTPADLLTAQKKLAQVPELQQLNNEF